jgi:ATP-dependent RNA helicase SUPV3L1/SUV3
MLERLSDLIRARIAFRPAEAGAVAPTGATGDGGFRVVPDLMSVVGCSGEEFVSILKALGFRLERRKIASPQPQEGEPPGDGEAAMFEEIWRPGRRKEARDARRASYKPRAEHRAKPQRRERPKQPKAQQTRAERKRIEHSPFAALEALKGRLAPRQPEGS